ncbi:prephenate dehydrogenase/arogenate dehydrogenase family protein [Candidatus Latescibacterota bacterium]
MYNTIVIVGVGLLGGSLGLAIRRTYPEARVIGVSSSETIKRALEVDVITEGCGYSELSDVAQDADLVILCTPIHRIRGHITVLARAVREGVLITDVGSTKRAITNHAAEVLPKGAHFVGGHPMAGSERRGVDAADPFLFQNAIYVLTPADGVPDDIVRKFSRFLDSIGATVVVMEADIHDRIAAAVSHLPQMLAVALVKLAGRLDDENAPYLRLAAGGFRDLTRIASSPFGMWDDIFRSNDDAVKEIIDTFIDELQTLRDHIGSSDLGEDFEVASITRATIPKDTKGFLAPLHDVLVIVEDRTGELSEISTVLFKANINIKDVEVLKVREGEGGTMRFAFEDEESAKKAVQSLESIGYIARLRR